MVRICALVMEYVRSFRLITNVVDVRIIMNWSMGNVMLQIVIHRLLWFRIKNVLNVSKVSKILKMEDANWDSVNLKTQHPLAKYVPHNINLTHQPVNARLKIVSLLILQPQNAPNVLPISCWPQPNNASPETVFPKLIYNAQNVSLAIHWLYQTKAVKFKIV